MRGPARKSRGAVSAVGRWSGWDQRRLAPARWFPARSRAGIQAFSRESPDAKSRGGMPPPPLFYGPLVATRSFWRLWHVVPVVGLLRGPCTCPDLETFFRKMLFRIFLPGKMRSKSVLGYRRKSSLYRVRDNDPQNQRVGTSGYKTGGPGGVAPGALSSGFLRRKPGSPAGVGGGNHLAGPALRRS